MKYFPSLIRPDIHLISCTTDLYNIKDVIACDTTKYLNTMISFSHTSKLEVTYKTIYPDKNILWIDRYINSDVYKNYMLPKKYDILIYATRNIDIPMQNQNADLCYTREWEQHNGKQIGKSHQYYPLRNKFETLIMKNLHKYNVKILPQSGSLEATQYVNESLSQLINESYLTLACCSRTDALYDKYLEIACSQSCIIGDIPSDYIDVFTDNICYINEWMSDEEILSIIDNELSDKRELAIKTERMADICRTNYSLEKFTEKMDGIIEHLTI